MTSNSPPRRRFLALSGGGVILAATAGLTSCTRSPFAMPAQAISAWREPEESLSLRHWVLSHALLAPNPHNRQPWQVSLPGDDEIVLRLDPERLLPHTDPFGRQILVGTGAFLELLNIAAAERGHRTQTDLFPEGAYAGDLRVGAFDTRPVARIRLIADETVKPDPLFAQIFNRHTERGGYDLERGLPAQASTSLQAATASKAVSIGIVQRDGPGATLATSMFDLAKKAWAIELKTPHTMMESVKLLRVGAAEIAQYRDGISITDPMLVILDKVGLFDRSAPPDPEGSVVAGQLDEFNKQIESTPGLFWINTQDNSRQSQIAAGQAYARAQLVATSLGLVMHPLSQALQEYPEMAGPYSKVQQSLQADPQAGPTVQMLCRIGHLSAETAPDGPAPRRGLDAHLTA